MIVSNVLAAVFLFSMPGGSEWVFILVFVLIFFGGKKIPELMKGLGKGMREFKDAKENVRSEIEEGMKEKDKDEELRELRQQLQQAKQAQQTQPAQELPK